MGTSLVGIFSLDVEEGHATKTSMGENPERNN